MLSTWRIFYSLSTIEVCARQEQQQNMSYWIWERDREKPFVDENRNIDCIQTVLSMFLLRFCVFIWNVN